MRTTATAFVAALALLMAVACAEQEETSTDKQPATAGETQKAHPKAAMHKMHKKHHAKHADPVAHADKVAELVGLDDAQKAKVLAVFKNESLSWKERKAKLHDIMTPEQQAKLKAAHKGHKGHKFSAEKAKFHADKMQEKLGITDAQKAELQAALSTGDWSKIKNILTADQFDELKRLKRSHGYHGKHGAHGKDHAGKHDCAGKDHAGKHDCGGAHDCGSKGDCPGKHAAAHE